ncbi:MAG: hypothetical protein HQK67_00380 [Desulfamplus sp.]|nr:hypothetical protein [Desulfamplus sp.]
MTAFKIAVLESAFEHGSRIQKDKADAQMDLFADMDGGSSLPVTLPAMPDIEEWESSELLALEKETLGFYVTGHPLEKYRDIIAKYANATSLNLHEMNEKQTVRMGGTIRPVKVLQTKKGDTMAFTALDDIHGSVEVVVFPEVYAQAHQIISNEDVVIVQAEVQKRENSIKLLAESIVPIDRAEQEWTANIVIQTDASNSSEKSLDRLKTIIDRYPGSCNVFLEIKVSQSSSVVVQLSSDNNLSPDPALFKEVNALLGHGSIETCCASVKQKEKRKSWPSRKNG